MRIGMILDQHFPPDPRVENEAKLLVRNGHEVCLFSFSRISHEDSLDRDGINIYRYRQSWLVYKLSALVHTVSFYSRIVSRKIEDFIERVKPDVLHVHDMVIAEAVLRANQKYNLPVVLDLHENRPEIMKLYKHVNQYPGRLLINLDVWNRKQSELIRRADFTVVVTEEARQEVVRNEDAPADRVIVVPNTIDKDIFYSYPLSVELIAEHESYFNILYVGDISLRRGTDTAIRAVALLKDDIPNILLTFVGTSSQQNQLERLVAELGIGAHVKFRGWQDLSLFPSFIHSSHVCLSPLKRNLHHDTTYANKLFQYMAMGKPVVVSNCPAQAHVVEREKCGLVHQAEDAGDLARCILKLYESKELREEMGERGKRAVQETYHWDSTGQTLVRLYNRLTSQTQESLTS